MTTWLRDWRLARYLGRRCRKRSADWIIRRKSDGSLWAPGHPQDFGYAMRGLFWPFHFYRVRIWRGVPVASRRVFWLPGSGTEFGLERKLTRFDLPPWPVAVECAKIDARLR